MSRTNRRTRSLSALPTSACPVPAFATVMAVAALLAAAVPAAYGQDATSAARQSANPSSPAPGPDGAGNGAQATAASAGTPGNGSPASGAGGAGNAQGAADAQAASTGAKANGAAKSGKPPAVCFKLTGRCVESAKAPTAQGGTASASKQGPLNLTAPDVRTVVSADELKEPLPSNEQITEVQEDQTVSVKGEGVPADVPLGFGAIWWALNHPSQAWRIVLPAE